MENHSNFSFLGYFRQFDLCGLAQKAEQHYPAEPDLVLLQLRKYTEAVVRLVAEKQKIDLDGQARKNLFQALTKLEENAVAPRFSVLAHNLRKRCNRAAHLHGADEYADEEDPRKSAAAALRAAYDLGLWLYQNYGPKQQHVIRKFTLPGNRAVPDADTRNTSTRNAKPDALPPKPALRETASAAPPLVQAAASAEAGIYYRRGSRCDLPGQYRLALPWYRQAAALGHAEAAFRLGMLYLVGNGTDADPDQARHWLHAAARLGHPSARAALAEYFPTPSRKSE